MALIRFLLTWSSLSPVFVLWAIRGVEQIADRILIPVCALLVCLPALILWVFWKRARKYRNVKTIEVNSAEDHRDHLLLYLFAMLIPLYEAGLAGVRDAVAAGVALIMVLTLFWYMRLHYINFFFALAGYRIFIVESGPSNTSSNAPKAKYTVISKRTDLPIGKALTGIRLGGDVLVEIEK